MVRTSCVMAPEGAAPLLLSKCCIFVTICCTKLLCSASISETVWAKLRVGSEDAERLLEGGDLLLAHCHTVCIAHACVDASWLELHKLLDRSHQDFSLGIHRI